VSTDSVTRSPFQIVVLGDQVESSAWGAFNGWGAVTENLPENQDTRRGRPRTHAVEER